MRILRWKSFYCRGCCTEPVARGEEGVPSNPEKSQRMNSFTGAFLKFCDIFTYSLAHFCIIFVLTRVYYEDCIHKIFLTAHLNIERVV